MSREPAFVHDCERCVYIGTVRTNMLYDIYACPQSGHPTMVARFGDEGPDYHSGGHDIARLLTHGMTP